MDYNNLGLSGFEPEPSPVDFLLDTIGLAPGLGDRKRVNGSVEASGARNPRAGAGGMDFMDMNIPYSNNSQLIAPPKPQTDNFALPSARGPMTDGFMPELPNMFAAEPYLGGIGADVKPNAKVNSGSAATTTTSKAANETKSKPASMRKPATPKSKAKPASGTATATAAKPTQAKSGTTAAKTATTSTTAAAAPKAKVESGTSVTGASEDDDKATKKRSRRAKLSPEERERRKQERLELRRVKKSAREKQRRNRENQLFEELADLCELPKDNRDKSSILAAVIGTIVDDEDNQGGTDSEFDDTDDEDGAPQPKIPASAPMEFSVPKSMDLSNSLNSILPPGLPPLGGMAPMMQQQLQHQHEEHHQQQVLQQMRDQSAQDRNSLPPPMQDPFALMPPPPHETMLPPGLQLDFPNEPMM